MRAYKAGIVPLLERLGPAGRAQLRGFEDFADAASEAKGRPS